MFRLSSEVLIEKTDGRSFKFTRISSCHLENDRSVFTGTCTLKLPRKVKWTDQQIPLSQGDSVTVRLGYNDNLVTRFVGTVQTVGIKSPLELTCEDTMCQLKKKNLDPISEKDTTLLDLLNKISLGGIKYVIYKNIILGAYRCSEGKVSALLSDLKVHHGVNSYFRLVNGQPVLYSGVGFPASDNSKVWEFKRGLNIIEDNTQLEVNDKTKESKFKGSFKTFGVPEVFSGDKIFFQPGDSGGSYYQVKKVTVDFKIADVQTSGYRQTIELGDKL